MTARTLALFCLLAGFALPGCVTENAVEKVGEETRTSAETATKAEYGRTLQLLDNHVAKYVFWISEGGDDARRERYIERRHKDGDISFGTGVVDECHGFGRLARAVLRRPRRAFSDHGSQ